VKNAYQAANRLVQAIISSTGVDQHGLPKSDIIVVSDHGFDPFHTTVNVNTLLAGLDPNKVKAVTSGPAVNVYISLQGREPDGTVTPAEYVSLQQQIVHLLRSEADTNPYYTLGNPRVPVFDKVYARPLPSDLGDPSFGREVDRFVGQDSGDVYALLTSGYNFDGAQTPVVPRQGDIASSTPFSSVPSFYGAHGYDPDLPHMSAIFFAAGPDIRHSFLPLLLVHNIDIAPTVEGLLGVQPSPLVEGRSIPLRPTRGQW
jgi:predicted AlkP superfamily pyrophosphatase or phosphodiesterase